MSYNTPLQKIYDALAAEFSPCHWWPGETPFEVAVGAVLTQNTAWHNVEKALALLRERNALHPVALAAMPRKTLEECLRPSGIYKVKAQRLTNLLQYLQAFPQWDAGEKSVSLSFMQHKTTEELRAELLAVGGIGPETADCILLYALGRPSFVGDAYTRRIFSRHGFLEPDAPYAVMQRLFMDALPQDVPFYNEFHALIVRTGHTYCKKTHPLCTQCPLGSFPHHGTA